MSRYFRTLSTALFLTVALAWGAAALPVPAPRDLLWVNVPRTGGETMLSRLPETSDPMAIEPGSHLMLLPKGETVPRILVNAGADGAVLDPSVNYFNGARHIVYSLCPDVRRRNTRRLNLPLQSCHLWEMELATGTVEQLTDDTMLWHPQGSMGPWSTKPNVADPPGTYHLGYGIFAQGAIYLPDGNIYFLSNGAGLNRIKGNTTLSLQGYILDRATKTVRPAWNSPGGSMHPVLLPTGEIAQANKADQGSRDSRLWDIQAIWLDGGGHRPVVSATMDAPHANHFHTPTADGQFCWIRYYPQNNGGAGTLWCVPLISSTGTSNPPALPPTNGPRFGPPDRRLNPKLFMAGQGVQHAYTPVGAHILTPWAPQADLGSVKGKVSHPHGAPEGIYVAYSPGPASHTMRPTNQPRINFGVYLLPDGAPVDEPGDMVEIYKDTAFNAVFIKSIHTWKDMYGVDHPPILKTPNDGQRSPYLPAGTTASIIGTSGVALPDRESKPWHLWQGMLGNRRSLYTDDPGQSNLFWQGGDVGVCDDTQPYDLEILIMAGVGHLSYKGTQPLLQDTRTFDAEGGIERYQVLATIPLGHKDAQGTFIKNRKGKLDLSFKAILPSHTPYTFRLKQGGITCVHAFTWRLTVDGENRDDCNGCHDHSDKDPILMAESVAGQPGYVPVDLRASIPETVEYHRDIEPIIDATCVTCHMGVNPPGNLDLATKTLVGGIPKSAAVLIANRKGQLGGYPPLSPGGFARLQLSRYIFAFAPRWSLLFDVFMGRRTDGLTNASLPTETTPGDRTTLPAGSDYRQTDIDLRAEVIQAHAHLQHAQGVLDKVERWISLGTPIDLDTQRGWLIDGWDPVITLYDGGTELILGMHDVGTGLDMSKVVASLDGQPQSLTDIGGGRWQLPNQAGRWEIRAADTSGNQAFYAAQVAPRPPPPPPDPDPTMTPGQTLYEQCGLAGDWKTLTPAQKRHWQHCAVVP